MPKLNKILIKLDNHMNVILKTILEKADKLEEENRIYRIEILRLEKIQKELIELISSKMFAKDKTHASKSKSEELK